MTIASELIELELEELSRMASRQSLLEYTQRMFPGYLTAEWNRILCEALEDFNREIERGLGPRYIILAPPQHGKSTIVSRSYPAWTLGKHPDWPLIIGSYAASLATGHGRWTRNTLSDPRHTSVFPECVLADDSAAADQMATTKGGQLLARGIGGGTTGNPAKAFVIDDPFADREEADSPTIRAKVWDWYQAVATTRLAPGGGVLVMHTRWHTDDLVGKLLDKSNDAGADKWRVLNFPALAEEDDSFRKAGDALHPERYGREELERKKRNMPSRDWLALYQQRPMSDEGGYFKKSDFRTYTETPRVGEVCLAGDLAYKTGEENDRTCLYPFGMTEGGDVVILPDIRFERMETDKSIEAILELVTRYKIRVVCMGRDAYQSIGPVLRRIMAERKIWCTIKEVPERKDKESRARGFQGATQMRRVLFPEGELFRLHILPELLAFPGGKRDDAVDAGSNVFWLMDNMHAAQPVRPPATPVNPDLAAWKKRSQWQAGNDEKPRIQPLFGS